MKRPTLLLLPVLALAILTAPTSPLRAQRGYNGSIELKTALERLNTVGSVLMIGALALLLGGFALEAVGQWAAGPSPQAHSYGAAVWAITALAGAGVGVSAIMGLYVIARRAAGMLGGIRRSTFDNVRLFWHFAVAQAVIGIILVHGFPRAVGT